jgi:tartrate dehydratase beta subunit/fumarate hydratase class I family protein
MVSCTPGCPFPGVKDATGTEERHHAAHAARKECKAAYLGIADRAGAFFSQRITDARGIGYGAFDPEVIWELTVREHP